MNRRPNQKDFDLDSFFAQYISLIPETEILPVLRGQIGQLESLVSSISAEKLSFQYAPGKWTIAQVLGHLADAEKVFGYRALVFGRGDKNELPGFDEQTYVDAVDYSSISKEDLLESVTLARRTSIKTLEQIPPKAWDNTGTANKNSVSVRALAFIMAGHMLHHIIILQERYLA